MCPGRAEKGVGEEGRLSQLRTLLGVRLACLSRRSGLGCAMTPNNWIVLGAVEAVADVLIG